MVSPVSGDSISGGRGGLVDPPADDASRIALLGNWMKRVPRRRNAEHARSGPTTQPRTRRFGRIVLPNKTLGTKPARIRARGPRTVCKLPIRGAPERPGHPGRKSCREGILRRQPVSASRTDWRGLFETRFFSPDAYPKRRPFSTARTTDFLSYDRPIHLAWRTIRAGPFRFARNGAKWFVRRGSR